MSNERIIVVGIAGLFTVAALFIGFASWVDNTPFATRNATLAVLAALLALLVLRLYEVLRK
jgi:hypothetical protein